MDNVNRLNIGENQKNTGMFQSEKRNKKRAIHTTLKPSDIRKLEEYGNGRLNVGIEKVLEIAESKQYNVKEQLMKIASQIMIEETDKISMN